MESTFETTLERAFRHNTPTRLGVAVSGGGDSVALLHLLLAYAEKTSTRIFAVTVDHGLRSESAAEAAGVSSLCRGLGVPHDIMKWPNWTGQGNLQNAARKARYKLMAKWASERDIPIVALGHTADDQAETVLMRIARRSGVDGLSGMPTRHVAHGIEWIRPLLKEKRGALRSYLRKKGVGWVEDPSNDDLGYDRIKARRALEELASLGIDVDALCAVASNMNEARKSLGWQAFSAAREFACVDAGAVILSQAKLRLQPNELIRRLLVEAIGLVSSNEYPPRRDAISHLIAQLEVGKGAALAGCRVLARGGLVWVFRETKVVLNTVCAVGALWDGKWTVTPVGPNAVDDTLEVRALGEAGLAQIEGWRDMKRPREMLAATPGVWRGAELIAAPTARVEQKWHAEWNGDDDRYFAALLSH